MGFFHLDRGLPHTVKAILIRPGKVALEYIAGKRKKHYNFFYLLLIIIGIYLFIQTMAPLGSEESLNANVTGRKVVDMFRENRKMIIFSLIPILAISAFLIFRKLRLTLVEFFIPSAVAVIGSSIFNILYYLLFIIQDKLQIKDTFSIFYWLQTLLEFSVIFFPLITFFQFTKGNYSIYGKIWRIIVFYLLCFFIISIAALIIAGILSQDKSIRIEY